MGGGRHQSQRGFTLIEVLVTIAILLVGVLGVVALVDGASAVSAKTKAREGGTNVARSIIEVARAVPYKGLTGPELLAALQARPGLADSLPGEGHTIMSRGVTYKVELEACSIDDPKDDLGVDDGTIDFCSESPHATSPSSARDRNPDDYKRIAVTLTWRGGKVTQTSLITNPVGGLGPSVVRLEAPSLTGAPLTVTNSAVNSIVFNAETSTGAAEVNWSVNGDRRGAANAVGGSDRQWTFTWNINSPTLYHDCTYVVQAHALDEQGRAGAPKALTVVLNRALPIKARQVEGGRNGNGSFVDLQWQPNPECDVVGYRVYRAASPTGPWTQVTCLEQTTSVHEATSCLDEQAPDAGPLWYVVAAVDTSPAGGQRVGATSDPLPIVEGNAPPDAPTGVSACLGGTPDCNEPDGTPASSGVTVVRWDAPSDPDGDPIYFYRIYRDGTGYSQRVAEFFPGPGALAWTDPDSPDGTHTYRVTAVDPDFGESLLSEEVTFP